MTASWWEPDGFRHRMRRDEVAVNAVAQLLQDDRRTRAFRDIRHHSFSTAMFFAAEKDSEPILIKVGVQPHQVRWMRMLSRVLPNLFPRVYGAGQSLAGHRLGWLALERVRFGDCLGLRGWATSSTCSSRLPFTFNWQADSWRQHRCPL